MSTNENHTPSRPTLEALLAQQNRVSLLCYRCGKLGIVTGDDNRLRCGPCGVAYEEGRKA